ncbi:hypothetical protein B7P43_G10604 [Cryptotermes secundus]|uniref:Uncharacterized protein n=1 Tax=Cryptotermes secundus TaxID=105785 RepID=A0A2J7QXD6_9NEOP|nr:hypothetical protein B7P43_G10604 [Cryptotermes secundus]
MIKSRRMRWEGHAARMREKKNAYRILVGKPEGKRPLGRPSRRVDNIKMGLREIARNGMDWTDMAQDRYQLRALVDTVEALRRADPQSKESNKLSDALIKRLGSNAHPFTMEVTPLAPPSVQLVPAKEYSGAPIGTSYDVRAYAEIRSNSKGSVGWTVCYLPISKFRGTSCLLLQGRLENGGSSFIRNVDTCLRN